MTKSISIDVVNQHGAIAKVKGAVPQYMVISSPIAPKERTGILHLLVG
jgi:hypothetical protein